MSRDATLERRRQCRVLSPTVENTAAALGWELAAVELVGWRTGRGGRGGGVL